MRGPHAALAIHRRRLGSDSPAETAAVPIFWQPEAAPRTALAAAGLQSPIATAWAFKLQLQLDDEASNAGAPEGRPPAA